MSKRYSLPKSIYIRILGHRLKAIGKKEKIVLVIHWSDHVSGIYTKNFKFKKILFLKIFLPDITLQFKRKCNNI